MAMNRKALDSYHSVHLASSAPYADGVQLIQMLFDGLIDTLSSAEGEIERKNIQEKCRALNRATSILCGLQDSLDFNKGSDLARNLSDLYEYMIRRVMFANLHNDVNALQAVKGSEGAARDSENDVTWYRCSAGQRYSNYRCRGEIVYLNWQDAMDGTMDYAVEFSEKSGITWRLPQNGADQHHANQHGKYIG